MDITIAVYTVSGVKLTNVAVVLETCRCVFDSFFSLTEYHVTPPLGVSQVTVSDFAVAFSRRFLGAFGSKERNEFDSHGNMKRY